MKLRPVVPAELPAELRALAELQRRGRRDAGRIRLLGVDEGHARGRAPCSESVAGERPIRKLFSKEQRALLRRARPGRARAGRPVGPRPDLRAEAASFAPEEFGRKLVAEMWLYPDGSRILELSTKCAPGEAFQVAAEARAFLAGKGVDLSGEQQTKTKTALEFFSANATGA